jgi:glyoxylase-like metal-dependent hydrolase (beta-lactamase superfamily II)
MSSLVKRRSMLKLSLGSLAALSLQGAGVPVFAQQKLQPQALKDSFFLIDAGGSNVLVCNTSEGLVLVDSGVAAFSASLMETLASLNPEGVHTLFNTHWHDEQCGANAAIGKSGASIIAHQKTWHHLSTEYYLPHEERYHQPLPEAGRPTVKFYRNSNVQVGNTTIEYGALVEPHTDADIYVYFPEANILAAGGAVSSDRDPELDWYGGGWLGGRATSLDTLVQLTNAETLIVPAGGRVMTQAELIAERDMTQELYQRLNTLIRKGCSASCMQQEGALEGLGRTWADPQRFLYAAYKGLWAHHYNLAPDIL